MRLAARALFSVMLVCCCCQDIWAAEAGSRWWPFGKDESAVSQPPGAVTPSNSLPQSQPALSSSALSAPAVTPQQTLPIPNDESSDSHWMFNSPRTKVSWPSFHAPKFALHNPFSGSAADESAAATNRNSWVEKSPEPPRKSPLQVMNDGAKRVGSGTKNAWHKTVDALTPGESTDATSRSKLAQRQVKPPFWKRMLGQDQELQGPQTVPEWMAQQRLEP